MPLRLAESQAVSNIAQHLYGFLPGKAHPYANQAISFEGVASGIGLSEYWQGGSKLPALNQLLSLTLEFQRGQFCGLIIEIVRNGIVYRQAKSDPITREAVSLLNDLIRPVGFKIPELHDPAFLESLPKSSPVEPKGAGNLSDGQLKSLQKQLLDVTSLPPTSRGLALEKFLGELFEAFRLTPRDAFRLVGEQIDGSFQFHDETYLLEAKWHDKRIGQEELLVFSGKVSGKAKWSRGLFVSISGYTQDGLDAFSLGKPTNIICMDGLDLYHVLQGKLQLWNVLERKTRRAAETNEAFVPVRELFPEVI